VADQSYPRCSVVHTVGEVEFKTDYIENIGKHNERIVDLSLRTSFN
jgi:hypothetical protein